MWVQIYSVKKGQDFVYEYGGSKVFVLMHWRYCSLALSHRYAKHYAHSMLSTFVDSREELYGLIRISRFRYFNSDWPSHYNPRVLVNVRSVIVARSASSTGGDMITSWNGNIFRVAGPLCGEFTGHRWIKPKGQWRGALMFSLICAWTNDWANNEDTGDLKRHRAHYDVSVMDELTTDDKMKDDIRGVNMRATTSTSTSK